MKFSKKIVLFTIILNVLAFAAILFVHWHTGSEPAVAVGGWFAFTSTELWSLSKIKRTESENQPKNDEVDPKDMEGII